MDSLTTQAPTPADLHDASRRVLIALAGPDARLRDGQQESLDVLLRPGARVLVVQATGWGKSAVYWMATAARRAAGAGPTLVVSPLLSLMRDQVAAAERAGLRAATLNSSNLDAWSDIEDDLRLDRLDVLLVSPERLANPGFGRRVLDGLAGRLGLVVIDEAHAISDWGHDFRPDYRRVAKVLQRLHPDAPVLATTATANARVVVDVAAQLGDALVVRGPLARASLQLATLPLMDPLQRYAWVVDNLPRLPGSGIIYTLTVADAERLTEALQRRYAHDPALRVESYVGRLAADVREEREDALRDNRLKALVATSALGMGYDKPDVGFVIHVGAPPTPVAYYQQVGRAGRAIDRAVVALLPSASDEAVWDYFATSTLPTESDVRAILAALDQASAPMSVPALEAETGLRRTRAELLLKQLAVDDIVERSTDGWTATGATWHFDAEHVAGVLATRRREAQIMRDYTRGRRCLMQLLQESLDDPQAEPCGRCSVCTGSLPDGLTAEASAATLHEVGAVLRSERHLVEPRKMWPGGAFGTRGRIPARLQAHEGRALVFADAPEWAAARRSVLTQDGPAPQELLDAAVATLAAWKDDWPTRPQIVIDLAATGLGRLTTSVADHLAEVGRLARATWRLEPATVPDDASSGDEALAWRNALAHSPIPEVNGAAVLLVVDRTRSRWIVAVAAATLLEQGASAVLPLVIHQQA